MEKKKSKFRVIDKIVDTILDLPVKNLEKKIKESENEIFMRRNILNEALLNLGTREIQLEKKIWQMRYAGILGSAINVKVDLEKELARTEIKKTEELVSYFRDVSQLKEKLQKARQELELEKEKRKLVKS